MNTEKTNKGKVLSLSTNYEHFRFQSTPAKYARTCLGGLLPDIRMKWSTLLFPVLALATLAGAADWKPAMSRKEFSAGYALTYFDDSPVVLIIDDSSLYISEDNAKNWQKVDLKNSAGQEVNFTSIHTVDYAKELGFALSTSKTQFYTRDRGKTWTPFEVDHSGSQFSLGQVQVNYANHDYLLLSFEDCSAGAQFLFECKKTWFFSDDGLKTPPKKVDYDDLDHCLFAKSNKAFTAGPDEKILCSKVGGDQRSADKKGGLLTTNDFFKTISSPSAEFDKMNLVKIEVVQSFIIATVSVDKYTPDAEIILFISKDGDTFRRAYFEDQLKSWMFRILPSTPQSLYIAIQGQRQPRNAALNADLYKSDSSGLFFDKIYENFLANALGLSDITMVQEVEGVILLLNHENADQDGASPLAKSRISIDDGKTWQYLKTTDDDDCDGDSECSLNLMWTAIRNTNGNFVTGPTPGILVGIGNTGKYLTYDLKELKTYVSRDNGLTWKKVTDKSALFTFADLGNIIVAIPIDMSHLMDARLDPNTLPNSFLYSLDQGDSWTEVDFGDHILPLDVFTSLDGSTQQVLVTGEDSSFSKVILYAIDFTGAFERTCSDDDFEDWYARKLPDSDTPVCVLGHKEKFRRRKQKAECFVNHPYEDLKVIEEPCKCTVDDTECTFGFIKGENDMCEPVLEVLAANQCANQKGSIKITTRQMIPGDTCDPKGGYEIQKDDFTFDCEKDLQNMTAPVKVTHIPLGERVAEYFYLNYDADGLPDETLFVITESKSLYVSFDGGSSFGKFLGGQHIVTGVYSNPYKADHVYILTEADALFFSPDRGVSLYERTLPVRGREFDRLSLTFNKHNASEFIVRAERNCANLFSSSCVVETYHTKNFGESFERLVADANTCNYVGSLFDDKEYAVNETLIVCDQLTEDRQALRLISSTDYFRKDSKTLFDKIVGFAQTGKFLVVARLDDDNSLTAFVSADGKVFAEAKFPKDVMVTRQTAYTILDVNSDQIFLHVTTHSAWQREFGALLKSNYNGTLYVQSLSHVNRNEFAFVDFESVQSLEGIATVNVVANYDAVVRNGDEKAVKTMITYNDGAEWDYLVPPPVDSEGNKYKCSGKKECTLNLHSFTERNDPSRDTYSSASAVGLLFGVGNVGTALLPYSSPETATFFSNDAGATWKEVKKGNYMWEFGDQGTILVLVKQGLTNTVSYSLDEGQTWQDYQFAESPANVWDIATVPSDTSRKFILLAKDDAGRDEVYSLNFAGLQRRQCELVVNDHSELADFTDYEYWLPKHPYQSDNCLFGHEARYPRRKASQSDCFVGAAPLNKLYKKTKNCKCTRHDFECDYNFVLAADGTCQLIKGLKPEDPIEYCQLNQDQVEYWEPTGYRKIPMSTCEQGLELDKWISHPCPGKKEQYRDKYGSGLHGAGLFWVIFAPIAAFVGAATFVYDRGIRRNGGFARFGEIRLDEDEELHLIEETPVDRAVNKVVRGGLVFVSAVVALQHRLSSFLKNGLFSRFRRGGLDNYERFASFSDRIIDDEDESLFDVNANDDDAREIDDLVDEER
ncbi:hypothetical protein KL944_002167 [Ogataea haglerorum]|nr:hypothetical protein KL944_002167 [Ogataea haglerorum]